jgi:two-component system, sensor histidine kinase
VIVTPDLPPQPAPRAESGAVSFPDLYILMAEDNALVAEVTQAVLAKFVGRIEIADNGRSALEKLRSDPPDLLITDLFMPEVNGDDLVRQIRALGMTLPIVGATAAVVGDDVERFRAAGADLVMSKPLDFKALREIMRKISASKKCLMATKH